MVLMYTILLLRFGWTIALSSFLFFHFRYLLLNMQTGIYLMYRRKLCWLFSLPPFFHVCSITGCMANRLWASALLAPAPWITNSLSLYPNLPEVLFSLSVNIDLTLMNIHVYVYTFVHTLHTDIRGVSDVNYALLFANSWLIYPHT